MHNSLLHSLNEYLGVELGRRADGHPIFKWKNSDELVWPAFATGRKVLKRVEVPLVLPVSVTCPECDGTGITIVVKGKYESEAPRVLCKTCSGKGSVTKTSDVTETAVPEYRADRQMRERNVWVMTKWLDPESLIWGWVGRHGGEARPTEHPSHERLLEMWNERFPGAPFPHNGWRVPTDATLPSAIDGEREPNWFDTRRFVARVKEQTRLSFGERIKDMLESEDLQDAAVTKRIEDEIRNDFPAFLNPKEKWGKRGGFLSLPWTNRDRQ